jgi:hypothetical protein
MGHYLYPLLPLREPPIGGRSKLRNNLAFRHFTSYAAHAWELSRPVRPPDGAIVQTRLLADAGLFSEHVADSGLRANNMGDRRWLTWTPVVSTFELLELEMLWTPFRRILSSFLHSQLEAWNVIYVSRCNEIGPWHTNAQADGIDLSEPNLVQLSSKWTPPLRISTWTLSHRLSPSRQIHPSIVRTHLVHHL